MPEDPQAEEEELIKHEAAATVGSLGHLLREMEALDRQAVTPDEIERRANALAGRWAMRLLSSINQAYALGVAEFAGLPHVFGEDYRALLRGLTPEEVAEAIRRAFQPAAGVWAEAE